MTGMKPVRWWVIDEFTETRTIAPSESDPVWEARYDNPLEKGKRTTSDLSRWPSLQGLINEMARTHRADQSDWGGHPLTPDHTLHGSGLQVMTSGGFLGIHLDYDQHPIKTEYRRALSLVCFLHPVWQPEWGGALVLCDPMGEVIEQFEPKPGRLVAFECSDLSYHGVEPITGPTERVSLAMSLLAPATPTNVRTRALFLPPR